MTAASQSIAAASRGETISSGASGQARSPDIPKRYWKGVLWSASCFAASCGGAPISSVRQYIKQQQTPH